MDYLSTVTSLCEISYEIFKIGKGDNLFSDDPVKSCTLVSSVTGTQPCMYDACSFSQVTNENFRAILLGRS